MHGMFCFNFLGTFMVLKSVNKCLICCLTCGLNCAQVEDMEPFKLNVGLRALGYALCLRARRRQTPLYLNGPKKTHLDKGLTDKSFVSDDQQQSIGSSENTLLLCCGKFHWYNWAQSYKDIFSVKLCYAHFYAFSKISTNKSA